MLASEMLLALMHRFGLKKQVSFSWNAWDMIVKPALLMVMAIGIYYAASSVCDPFAALPLFIKTGFHILILSLCYLLLYNLLFSTLFRFQAPKVLPEYS